MSVYRCVHTLQRCRSLQSPEEGVRAPEPGGTGSCEPLAMGAGTELGSSADIGRKNVFHLFFFQKRSHSIHGPGKSGTHYGVQVGF